MDYAAIILAAGKSKRMKSALPKAVHTICGKPVTRHVVDAGFDAGIEQVVVVVGHKAEAVKMAVGDDVRYALQEEQLGTGHATMQAMPLISKSAVLVLPGDAPLITPDTLRRLMDFHAQNGAAATLLTAALDEPAGYGRIIRGADGSVERIVEARDAGPEILAINEVATSIYCFDTALLRESLAGLSTDNAQGEYYLTDTIEILRTKGHAVHAVVATDFRDTLGINTRIELAEAAAIMRRRILDRLMLDGVTIVDPGTTYVDIGVTIGRDTIIHPCTVIETGSTIGENCVVGPFSRLSNTTLGNKVQVISSSLVDATIPDGEHVEPYKHVDGKER